MSKKSEFDASSSMLGYLYQIRYGLYLALRKLPEVEDPEQYNISIESLDDIAFDVQGMATELLQTKYHGKPGNLTDRSEDIWKTIRVWVDAFKNGTIHFGKTTLILITTESLSDNSLANCLSSGLNRDITKALKLMSRISLETNKTNLKGYQAYQSLSEIEKEALVNNIYILGKSDDFKSIRRKIYSYGRQYVASDCVNAFVDRLEGAWFDWCIDALNKNPTGVINLFEIQNFTDKIRPEYTGTNLPAEFADALPDILDINNDSRTFINQLRLLGAPKSMLEQAIVNYFRAFEQRTKWSADGLLQPGELKGYDNRLYEKWVENKSFLELNHDIKDEIDKRKYASSLYQECIQNGIVPIRKDFLETYVSKGSYQILSDQLQIGWHPDFKCKLLESSNENVA